MLQALAFRRAATTASTPTQLYSGSFDRTIKIHDLSVMGYIETLFGHQAPVLDLDSLMRETAVSVGGRDKTVRFWKVPEESQLVFRGGGKTGWEDILEGGNLDDEMDVDGVGEKAKKKPGKTSEKFIEGSIECCAMVDESTFVSGGDSGCVLFPHRIIREAVVSHCANRSIHLWSTQKKKPIFTQALAHGMDESQVETEDMDIVRKPRWVTALGCLRYSDLFASGASIPYWLTLFFEVLNGTLGSWDGEIRLWKLDRSLKSFSLVGSIPAMGVVNSIHFVSCPRATVDSFSWAKRDSSEEAEAAPSRASTKAKSLLLVAGVGQEMRMGRWVQKKGEGVLNGALVVALHTRTSST